MSLSIFARNWLPICTDYYRGKDRLRSLMSFWCMPDVRKHREYMKALLSVDSNDESVEQQSQSVMEPTLTQMRHLIRFPVVWL